MTNQKAKISTGGGGIKNPKCLKCLWSNWEKLWHTKLSGSITRTGCGYTVQDWCGSSHHNSVSSEESFGENHGSADMHGILNTYDSATTARTAHPQAALQGWVMCCWGN